ncbi:putative aminopeptidase [Paucimonas lemoignei]|uniref:Putative aminopeptidase n=1 Tax=Paucimonas lemoignei TaxID=29443 RepID=A0A4R3HQV6_PAULE|nr:aminopeptidase [Paucimonas lemoignei]TCS33545.1 putative aminopeptidase [Paucimonas lemoignei]
MGRKWQIGLLCGMALLASGCAQLGYFAQAAQGQLSLMTQARPIDDWLADPGVNDKLKGQLSKVKEMRRFAAQELDLPDNGTFTSYADLKRPYVLWNVVATPALSLKARQWCFPVAGCVNYRGYYNKEEALAYAAELRRENYDVQVSGVPAYSTLGWFDDPVLSTFVQYPEAELARLIFHELAHQVAYAPGDSRFNEAFAVAVEEYGVERWVKAHGDDKLRENYEAQAARKRDFLELLLKTRKALESNYASAADDKQKLARKAEIFQAMQDDYQTLKKQWGGYAGYDRWFAEPLSNAHLALVATYHDLVPGFRALLDREKDLGKFYAAVRSLSSLEQPQRYQRLAGLAHDKAAPVQSAMVDGKEIAAHE